MAKFNETEKQKILAAAKKDGVTVASKLHGVSPSTLYAWRDGTSKDQKKPLTAAARVANVHAPRAARAQARAVAAFDSPLVTVLDEAIAAREAEIAILRQALSSLGARKQVEV